MTNKLKYAKIVDDNGIVYQMPYEEMIVTGDVVVVFATPFSSGIAIFDVKEVKSEEFWMEAE